MVILGAGASFDSANFQVNAATERWRPPMGQGLFKDDLFYGNFVNAYWQVRPLVHRFRGAKDSLTLEAELESLQEQSRNRALTREQLLALRYYLQRVIAGTCQQWSNDVYGNTNYVALVDEIDSIWGDARRREPVIFVTFNYDVLLDGALGQIGVNVGQNFDSYIANPQYKLIKPHGSVNWFHHVPVPNKSSHPYYLQIIPGLASETLKASGDFFIASEGSDINDLEGIPALSIPVAKKTDFEMPPAHLEALMAAIPQVTHLLVIGWRGNEQHFVDLLRALPRGPLTLKSLVVSGSAAGAKTVATALDLANVPPHISGTGFSGSFGAQLQQFLRR